MRGDNTITAGADGQVLRFTPTCVGTTWLRVEFFVPYQVHPHMRGDNECLEVAADGRRAVHPHMRGDNEK